MVTQKWENRKRLKSSKQTVLVSENIVFPVKKNIQIMIRGDISLLCYAVWLKSTIEKIGEGMEWQFGAFATKYEQKFGQWDWLSAFVFWGICTIFSLDFILVCNDACALVIKTTVVIITQEVSSTLHVCLYRTRCVALVVSVCWFYGIWKAWVSACIHSMLFAYSVKFLCVFLYAGLLMSV